MFNTIRPCVGRVPNYSPHHPLALHPHRLPHCITTTFEPWAAADMPPNVGSHSATITALNVDIGIITAAKDTLEIVPVKVVFESVIGILAFVRVRVLVLF